jgi:ABC-type dipeptide/oligopeptide/nickel transport system permease component
MLKFIVRRIFWTIPVLLVVIFLTFMMMRQIGGNPFRQSERAVTEATQRNLEEKFHVNDPWYLQYAHYVKGVATFDLGRHSSSAAGTSTTSSRPTSRSRSSLASTRSCSRSSQACRSG